MADDGLNFAVTLEDGVSAPSEQAAAGVEHLATELGHASGELQRFGRMQAQANAMNAAFDNKQDAAVQRMGRQHAAALAMNAAWNEGAKGADAVGEHMLRTVEPAEVMRHALEGARDGLREFASGVRSGEVKEAVSGIAETMAGLAQTLDLVVPGLGQVAAAAIRAGGAFVAMTVGIVQGGVEMALEVNAVNERLEATFQALGKGPDAGKATLGMLDDLSRKLPQSRTQLAEWTQQFEAMGITDLGALRHQIEATAGAQAIAGAAGAGAYESLTRKVQGAIDSHEGLLKVDRRMIATLHELGAGDMMVGGRKLIQGATVDAQAFGNALSQSLVEKGAGPLEAMGNEISTLRTKAQETFGHLFDGIDTAPITDALKSVIMLGDQGEPSGAALHDGIAGGLNAVIREIGEMITEAELWFLDLELQVLKSGVTMEDVKSTIHDVATTIKALVGDAKELWGMFLGVADAAVSVHDAIGTAADITMGGAPGGRADDPLAKLIRSPAHADGGVVARPAPGEFFASVAPGETIVPAGASSGVHIEHFTVQITAPQGVTDAQALSVTGLSVAFERLQLAAGR